METLRIKVRDYLIGKTNFIKRNPKTMEVVLVCKGKRGVFVKVHVVHRGYFGLNLFSLK